ncbi:translation initiation factor IF-2 [Rhipicephalus sanguineus]|nr:translation initiation factor IF-2 [Rhipicephalus sanguineus]
MWYLRKDLEWRRRAEREHEARKAALREARAAAERKANQRSQAERAFAAWCAMKSELEAARRAEDRRRSAKADEDRKRTEMRACALSERKCREWLARKQVEKEASLAKKQRITTSGDAEKAAANQSAFNAWLAGKGTKNSTEKFHVKCIDGQLFAVWR